MNAIELRTTQHSSQSLMVVLADVGRCRLLLLERRRIGKLRLNCASLILVNHGRVLVTWHRHLHVLRARLLLLLILLMVEGPPMQSLAILARVAARGRRCLFLLLHPCISMLLLWLFLALLGKLGEKLQKGQ